MMQLFFVDAEDWIFIILWREEFFDARIEHNIDFFSLNNLSRNFGNVLNNNTQNYINFKRRIAQSLCSYNVCANIHAFVVFQ